MRHAAIIEMLGGPLPLAKALGCHRTRVNHWRHTGIPPGRFAAIVALARRKGLAAEVTFEGLHSGSVRQARQPKQPRQARAA